jgi:hypothetical protein
MFKFSPCLFVLLLVGFISTHAHSAILLEEGSRSVINQVHIPREPDGFSLRNHRKVGVGFIGSGVWGILGAHLELNFSSEFSLQGGVGFGEGYQTFVTQIRRYISGVSFLPYLAGGIGRWYTAGTGKGEIQRTNPGFLADRFLSQHERKTGQFSEIFLFPSLGIQYLQLGGEWSGSSVFAEISLMVDIEDLVLNPTGALGYTYFF